MSEPLVDALAYALARAQIPTPLESSRDYAERLAPLVIESGYPVGRAVQEGPSALRLHDGLDVERLADLIEKESQTRPHYGRTPRESAEWIVARYRAASLLHDPLEMMEISEEKDHGG